ncbi:MULTISPECIES: ABC transporter permease [unclassified Gemella]|uniref:ABC transporter permease n=1 Tax=unclassified Gemella TaxID=2624949 RepID=UPI001C055E51|nr:MULTISPECIES: ABC-2 family transporter protein [unclassified Gemella]MBU0279068.1 ABC-2 family transporter protein [Gemella sp. zg-1178]QWQ39126.1 ABC-2 family transporter protein [Gemella sp. zg-570]
MKKHLYLYLEFLKMDTKRILSYKLDFLVGNLGYLLDSFTTLFILLITLNYTDIIGGFSLYQILFMYGFLTLTAALWEFFFVTTLEVPYLIQTGELDLFLLRPLNILYQFIIFQLDEEALFELITGIIIIVFALYNLDINITFIFLIKFILFTISAVLVREAIYLALVSFSFFSITNDGIKSILWQLYELSNYPINIYPFFIKVVLVIIPFSFVGYFPVINLINYTNIFDLESLLLMFIGLLLVLLVYKTIWNFGLKRYQSTGS